MGAEQVKPNHGLIQTSLLEMNPRVGIKTYGLPKLTEGLETSPHFSEARSQNAESLREMALKSSKEFNRGQRKVFDTLLSEILPGLAAKDLFSFVHRPFDHETAKSNAYFLEAPGGTGKTLTISAIQARLQFKG